MVDWGLGLVETRLGLVVYSMSLRLKRVMFWTGYRMTKSIGCSCKGRGGGLYVITVLLTNDRYCLCGLIKSGYKRRRCTHAVN